MTGRLILILFLTPVIVFGCWGGLWAAGSEVAGEGPGRSPLPGEAAATDTVAERALLEGRINTLREQVLARERGLSAARTRLGELTEARDSLLGSGPDRKESESVQTSLRDFRRNLSGLLKTGPGRPEEGGGLAHWAGAEGETAVLGPRELEHLLDLCFANLTDSTQIYQWVGPVIDWEGRERMGRNTGLGHITALGDIDGRVSYLHPGSASNRFLMAGRPSWAIHRNLRSYLAGETDSVYLDLSGGAAVSRLSQTKSMTDRLLAGGPLVWPILALGLAALFMVGERLVFLVRVHRNTDALGRLVTDLLGENRIDKVKAVLAGLADRPTDNVLRAGLVQLGQSREVLENALSEAILREAPRLERFLTPLKVLAAAAPLLGLLGTVTGMINTFDVITVHGTNDPRLMSGGISEALITTQLGLAVAIPVMVAASLLNRGMQTLAMDMEEKSLALTVALLKYSESGGGARDSA